MYALQRMTQDSFLKRFEVDDDVRKFRHESFSTFDDCVSEAHA